MKIVFEEYDYWKKKMIKMHFNKNLVMSEKDEQRLISAGYVINCLM